MHDYAAIARLEEGHCAATLREIGRETIDVAGGVACRDVPGVWVNRAEGIGLSGPVDGGEIARMVAWYDEAGIEPRVKICPYVHATLLSALGEQGFLVKWYEQLLIRVMGARERIDPPREMPGEFELRQVDRTDAAACRELSVVINRGFAPPGAMVSEANIELTVRCMMRERADTFAVYDKGVCVGGGGMEAFGEIGCLYGAVVEEGYRRRGIQQSLLAARLNAAAARGLRMATIGSAPGHDTERNVLRFGFEVAYSKTVMGRATKSAAAS